MLKTCSNCQRSFTNTTRHKECGSCRTKKKRVPCPICQQPMKKSAKTCQGCLPRTQSSNPNWKSGKTYHKAGYCLVRCPDHPRSNKHTGYVLEHILVMEAKLGRPLLPSENVHHINGIKDDNRADNLELWLKPQPYKPELLHLP